MKTYDELKAAGSGATVSVLQNVYAEDMVHPPCRRPRSTSTTASI